MQTIFKFQVFTIQDFFKKKKMFLCHYLLLCVFFRCAIRLFQGSGSSAVLKTKALGGSVRFSREVDGSGVHFNVGN